MIHQTSGSPYEHFTEPALDQNGRLINEHLLTSTCQAPASFSHAQRGSIPEELPLRDFMARCEPYFGWGGCVIDQPFQPRLPEGMIRAYLTHDKVVGFTHQYPRGLMPLVADHRPTGKAFEPASDPRYSELRSRLEADWIPELQEILGIGTHSLPVIWDTDFLYGPKTRWRGHIRPVRDQRQLNLRVPRVRNACGRTSSTGADRRADRRQLAIAASIARNHRRSRNRFGQRQWCWLPVARHGPGRRIG